LRPLEELGLFFETLACMLETCVYNCIPYFVGGRSNANTNRQVLAALCLAACLPAGALDATWTPADAPEDGPLPLSQRYRDKLDALEAKVGPAKFQELTGRVPPSQSQSGKATQGHGGGGGAGLGSALLALCPRDPKRVAAAALVAVGVAAVGYRLYLYKEATVSAFLGPLHSRTTTSALLVCVV